MLKNWKLHIKNEKENHNLVKYACLNMVAMETSKLAGKGH